MKTKLYWIVVLFLLVFIGDDTNAQSSPDWLWAKRIGGASSSDNCWGLAIDGKANIYSTGYFDGTVDFDPGAGVYNLTSAGPYDIFISKLDSAGNLVWAKSIGDTLDDSGYTITLDSLGYLYVTGGFQGTVDFDPGPGTFYLTNWLFFETFAYILKLDTGGNFVWAKFFNSTYDTGISSLHVDADGNVITFGSYMSQTDFDPGPGIFYLTPVGGSDVFMSKLDSAGNFIWAKSMGGTQSGNVSSSYMDVNGSIYTCGTFYGTFDFDPGAGVYNLTTTGTSSDAYISKLDTSGTFYWAKALGGTGSVLGIHLIMDSSGNIYTVGNFTDTIDVDPGPGVFNFVGDFHIFIAKYDNQANLVWAKHIETSKSMNANFITLDASGNIFTTGRYSGTVDFDPGPGTYNLYSYNAAVFILKLDSNGNFDWVKSMGGINFDVGTSLVFDAAGKLYAGGTFQSDSISFGPYNLINAGPIGPINYSDFFIAKLDDVPVGIEDINFKNGISIYPNPATDNITITLPQNKKSEITITITDMQGRMVKEKMLITPVGEAIDVSTLTPGVYLLKVNGQVQRFVKM